MEQKYTFNIITIPLALLIFKITTVSSLLKAGNQTWSVDILKFTKNFGC